MGVIFKDNYPLGSSIENPPLASGWSYAPAFDGDKQILSRNGSTVVGNLRIKATSEIPTWTSIISIPVGYRPASGQYIPAVNEYSTVYSLTCFVTSGAIQSAKLIPKDTIISLNICWNI